MDLLKEIRENAKKLAKRIVLPESLEERTLEAADFILKERIAELILIGNRTTILKKANGMKLSNIQYATFIDPLNNPQKEKYALLMYSLRKKKGLTMVEARELLEDPLYLTTIMIKNADADGEVAGAENATTDVLRPAFQYIKTMPGISVVSGAFLMFLNNKDYGEDGMLIFADCAVHPDPTESELAEIAIATGRTARSIAGIEPRIALLSFSTRSSAKHEMVDKVRNATEIAKKLAPEMKIDGELQADAAIVDSIAKKKAPDSDIAGRANVLVFPNLESGNIAYKLVQRLANAEAVGPILQGMAAPINDLSRGCSVSDIINLVAITANQAANL